MNPAISIFMPVYNGEKFVRRTIESITNQTFHNFELVCVDDTSTDNSLNILYEYALKDNRIKVFTKPHGGNVPRSWLFALPHLNGEYIFYTSQDDQMLPDLLEQTYKKAQISGADAIIPDKAEYYGEKKISKTSSGLFGRKDIELTGKQAFLHSLKWDIHAFVLWKAQLVKQIGFDDIATNSDEYATRNFFLNCNKVVFSEGTFYYGKENPDAITRKLTIKRFDWCITNQRLLQLMKDHQFEEEEMARFNYYFWGHTLYMNTLLSKYRKNLTTDECVTASTIIAQCYNSIDFNLIARHKKLKGYFLKVLFVHGKQLVPFIIYLYTKFYSKNITA